MAYALNLPGEATVTAKETPTDEQGATRPEYGIYEIILHWLWSYRKHVIVLFGKLLPFQHPCGLPANKGRVFSLLKFEHRRIAVRLAAHSMLFHPLPRQRYVVCLHRLGTRREIIVIKKKLTEHFNGYSKICCLTV
jgi:hypothetical protein